MRPFRLLVMLLKSKSKKIERQKIKNYRPQNFDRRRKLLIKKHKMINRYCRTTKTTESASVASVMKITPGNYQLTLLR